MPNQSCISFHTAEPDLVVLSEVKQVRNVHGLPHCVLRLVFSDNRDNPCLGQGSDVCSTGAAAGLQVQRQEDDLCFKSLLWLVASWRRA